MAFQWSQLKLIEIVDRLDRFAKLSGLDDKFEMFEEAMKRCKLDDKARKEFRMVREVLQLMLETNRQLQEIRVVIAWRNPDVTSGYTLQVEYLGRKPSSVSKV